MTTSIRKQRVFSVPFRALRNISSPVDTAEGRKVHVGQMPIGSILDFPTDENVRDYLLEAEGRTRRVKTEVHRAIENTLDNDPDNFSILNGGLTLVARDLFIDEKNNLLKLTNPSIIDGAQTQGVVRDYLNLHEKRGSEGLEELRKTLITVEIIVTADENLIAEISIARNFQNDVMTISIAGRRGQLDELQEAMQADSGSSLKLKKSETTLSDDYLPTEKLLQVITALTPAELWSGKGEPNKVFAYNMKSKCLKLFQSIHTKAKDEVLKKENPSEHEKYSAVYQYYLDIAATAWQLYEKWKSHSGFKGTRLWKINRDARGEIKDVPDGLVFPILAALSEFVDKKDDKWGYYPPEIFDEDRLIQSAKTAYMEMAGSNPTTMGKSKSCYSHVSQITKIYKSLS